VRKLDESNWQQRRQRLEELTESLPLSDCIRSAAKDRQYWLRQEAKQCGTAEQYLTAIRHLDRVIATEPRWQDFELRGRYYAHLGQYEKATQDHLEVGKRGGVASDDDLSDWRDRALARLAHGDIKEYRKVCVYLFERFSQTADPTIAREVATTCILVPDAIPDLQRMVRLAELAYARFKDNDSLDTVGYTLYRAGQLEQALERLEAAKSEGDIVGNLFRAMAHHRLGHAEDARKWMEKALRLIDQANKNARMGGHRKYVLLQREAESVLKHAKP
jgi:tetratricopeptide (TPR) repeat protein